MPAFCCDGSSTVSEKHISVDDLAADWLPQSREWPAATLVRNHPPGQIRSVDRRRRLDWISLAKAIAQAAPHRLFCSITQNLTFLRYTARLWKKTHPPNLHSCRLPGDIADECLFTRAFPPVQAHYHTITWPP